MAGKPGRLIVQVQEGAALLAEGVPGDLGQVRAEIVIAVAGADPGVIVMPGAVVPDLVGALLVEVQLPGAGIVLRDATAKADRQLARGQPERTRDRREEV